MAGLMDLVMGICLLTAIIAAVFNVRSQGSALTFPAWHIGGLGSSRMLLLCAQLSKDNELICFSTSRRD